jgi:DNA-binding CsgD family transcriptional regulator
MTLWERNEAIAILEGTYSEAAVAGRVVLVPGEAGIGKSALVTAFAERVRGKARVLWGACDPLITPRASGALQDIAGQAGGALSAAVASGLERSGLFRALLDELAGPRQRQRRILVVEDAHWADEATHDLIVFVGRRIERLNAMLVVTYRDDELGTEHPLRSTLAALPRSVVRPVRLSPLSRECVTEQAGQTGRDPAELYRLTGGNPLLVTEMLAVDGRALPATVSDLILARLRGLTPAAREVARLVAVMPAGADAVALRGQAAPVDACIAAGVLVARGERVSYRHELLRLGVEETLSPARRVALHRRALALLAAVDGIDAGDVPALLTHALAAANRAVAMGSHREAAAEYRAVWPYVDRFPPADRAELLERYANEAYLAGDAVRGLQARQAALAVRRTLADRGSVGENLRWISRMSWWNGQGAQARAAAAEAVTELEAGGPSRELAMAYSNRSQLHMLAHEVPEAVEWGGRARELADRVGDLETSVHAAINIATARFQSDDRAAEALRECHAAADRAGHHEQAARALLCVIASYAQSGQTTAAAAEMDAALTYAAGLDLDGYAQHMLGVRAGIRLEQCDWDGALADVDAALNRSSRNGIAVVDALVAKGRIQAARGDRAALYTLDLAAANAYGTEELLRIGPLAAARAEYFLLAGAPDRAADEAARGLRLARAKGHQWLAGELAYRLWQATGTAEHLTEWPEPYRLEAEGDWRGAASAWAVRGREYARLVALAHGDAAPVAAAIKGLGELGAAGTQRLLRADLRRRGVTNVPRGPRRTTVANAAGLTERQLEILALLGDGLSNPDIAVRLTLSRRTVEHHISAILGKLNVATRAQAVAVYHLGRER